MYTTNNFNNIHLQIFSFDAADIVHGALMNRFRYVTFRSIPFDEDGNYRFFNIENSGEFTLRVYECTTFDRQPMSYQVLSSKQHEWRKMFEETVGYKDIDFNFIKDSLMVWKWCITDNFPDTKVVEVDKIDSILRYWNNEATDEDRKFVGMPLNAFEYAILQKKVDALNTSTSHGHHYFLLKDLIKTYEEFRNV